ncbi:universal stress protein [Flavobacterium sp. B183]|uniref:universal stress protein n=1 Tax=Flavobacterium sp. B183 TaxID=907046 RepID=UPI00201EE650|nr:universal stress protein [Flavobacterium sp. B183]URC12061.1 universal stress protein [Flavobacterium sp. B183]
MKKILVATDFSNISKAGIRFAIQFASQTPCELIFYSVNTKELSDNIENHYKKIRRIINLKNSYSPFIKPLKNRLIRQNS